MKTTSTTTATIPFDQIAALGTVVTVWAHPDDETYLAGGVMSIARHLGGRVTCVTATNGDFASDEHERARVGALRAAELAGAMHVLGVDDVEQLGYRDGECNAVPDDVAVGQIARILADRRPDTIVTFGPDGLTGHPDHCAVARWTAAAAQLASPQARVLVPVVTPAIARDDRDVNSRFDVFEPGLPTVQDPSAVAIDIALDSVWLDTKYRALQCHASQTTGLIEALGEERYLRWIAREPLLDLDRWTPAPPR